MARGLMKWVGAAVLLSVGVALWLVPAMGEWMGAGSSFQYDRSPEELRERELSAEVVETRALLARLHLADRHREELEGRELGGAAAVIPVGLQATAPAETRDAWRERVDGGLRDLPRSGEGLDVAVFIHDDRLALPGGYRSRPMRETQFYLIEGSSGPVCAVSVPAPRPRYEGERAEAWWRERTERLEREFLGPCAFYAGHGLPGAGVARWLQEGGYVFSDDPRPSDFLDVTLSVERGTFGTRRGRYWMPPTLQSCLAGRTGSCRRWITSPAAVDHSFYDLRWEALARRSELIYEDYRWRGPQDTHLLADLQAEFGAGRFGRFWRSEKSMPEAFEDAFGEPPESWIRRWAVKRYGSMSGGPALSLLTVVLSFLTLGVTFAVAAYLTERRTVG